MALHTVSDIKGSVAGMLAGMDISNVDGLYSALERAAATVVQRADIPEASGIQNLTLYNGVIDYPINTTIFGTAINDIRPQGLSRNPNNYVTKTDQDQFDRTKGVYYPSGTMSTFEFHNGVPIIRIESPYPKPKIVLDTMSETTGWALVGSATNLAQDTTFFYQEPASLRFNLAAAGSQGGIDKTLQSPIDLTTYQGVGVVFLAVEMPTAGDITSYEVRIGSDNANYYTVTNTTGFLGAFTSGDFQLVPFDLATATTVGSPVITAIDYVYAVANYNGTAQTNMRFGGMFISLPSPNQILYQSAAVFLPVGSSIPLETITADTDTILFTRAAYTIYEFESALSVCQQTGGTAGDATVQSFDRILNGSGGKLGLYDQYRSDNPSQELRQTNTWYDNGNSYNSW